MKYRMKFMQSIVLTVFLLVFGTNGAWASVSQASVKPLSPDAGKASVYEITFSLSDPFPSAGTVVLEFPADFDLSQAILAGSPNVNGGFKVFVDGQKLIVRRSGLGQAVPAGKGIVIRVANIQNPKTAGQYSLSVRIMVGKKMLGERNSVSFSIQPKRKQAKPIR
ncbi:hypothetical protein BMS3Bbin03_02447 [bacterium BMS3Bbin03]|nr:hypothetical protein BMS3Bbin03_02447 [bacterium BMS3Bbin03]HDZ11621.1 hypothetical protein [Bacteroidota bacterium]